MESVVDSYIYYVHSSLGEILSLPEEGVKCLLRVDGAGLVVAPKGGENLFLRAVASHFQLRVELGVLGKGEHLAVGDLQQD